MKKLCLGLLCMLAVGFFVSSCGKDNDAMPDPVPRTKLFYTVDTVLALQNPGTELWEAWDYGQTLTDKDSIFSTWIAPIGAHKYFDAEDISNLTLIAKNGDRLEGIPRIVPNSDMPKPFSYSCRCENAGTVVNDVPNMISLTWVQPVPFTRPEFVSVSLTIDYWVWE